MRRSDGATERRSDGATERRIKIEGGKATRKIRFKDRGGNDFPEWKEKKLKEVASFFSGGTPTSTKKEYYNGTIPFIKSGEINASHTEQFISDHGFKNSSTKMVDKGDLLLALYGATSGQVAISKINGAINQAILCIRSSVLNTYFFFSYLSYKKEDILTTYIQGGQGNLSAEIIKSLYVPVPSLPEQEKIATFLNAIDEKTDELAKKIGVMKNYKRGLLQQLFV